MTFSQRVFRGSMLGAAIVIAGVAVYFLSSYFLATIALGNSGLKPFYQDASRAMWLGFCLQLAIIGIVFLVAAMRPSLVGRGMVMVLALLPLASTVLLFWFAASRAGAIFLGIGGLLTLLAALTWPKRMPPEPERYVSGRAPGSPLL